MRVLGVEFARFSVSGASTGFSPVSARLRAIAGSTWRRVPLSSLIKSRLKHLAYRCAGFLTGSVSRARLLSSQYLRESGAPESEPDELIRAFNAKDPGFAHCATCLSRFMHFIWKSRPDLQAAYDISDNFGRMEFAKWYLIHARREYGLSPAVYPAYVLAPLLESCEPGVRTAAEAIWSQRVALAQRGHSGEVANPDADSTPSTSGRSLPKRGKPGVSLTGYARGSFGMGQQLRAVAAACSQAAIPFSICSVEDEGHGSDDRSVDQWIGPTHEYVCNLFNLNADTLPSAYFRFGAEFFSQRRNIGYWAWELPRAPEEFEFALSMVEEVWAVSRFVEQAVSERSPVPVVHMPLAVVMPAAPLPYGKAHFGLPEDHFVFLFVFDLASYLERKNPIATVRAFMRAFPDKRTRVRLVLKTMNVRKGNESWKRLVGEAKRDARISILTTRMARQELLCLMGACDAFVSLHRSEGFALCIAESMWLGKPAIVTNFSGSLDFAREGTACAVDYTMCPVAPGAYPFASVQQQWAEASVEHASWYMRKLFEDEEYRAKVARAGQAVVQANHSPAVVGRRYAERLAEIGVIDRAEGVQ